MELRDPRANSLDSRSFATTLSPQPDAPAPVLDPDEFQVSIAYADNTYAKEGSTNRAGRANEWRNDTCSWAELWSRLRHVRIAAYGEKKNCAVFTAGELAGGSRANKAVKSVSLLVLDIDFGGTIASTDYLGVPDPAYSSCQRCLWSRCALQRPAKPVLGPAS